MMGRYDYLGLLDAEQVWSKQVIFFLWESFVDRLLDPFATAEARGD